MKLSGRKIDGFIKSAIIEGCRDIVDDGWLISNNIFGLEEELIPDVDEELWQSMSNIKFGTAEWHELGRDLSLMVIEKLLREGLMRIALLDKSPYDNRIFFFDLHDRLLEENPQARSRDMGSYMVGRIEELGKRIMPSDVKGKLIEHFSLLMNTVGAKKKQGLVPPRPPKDQLEQDEIFSLLEWMGETEVRGKMGQLTIDEALVRVKAVWDNHKPTDNWFWEYTLYNTVYGDELGLKFAREVYPEAAEQDEALVRAHNKYFMSKW